MTFRQLALVCASLSGCIDLRDRYTFGVDAGNAQVDGGEATCAVTCTAPTPSCVRPDTLLTSRVHACTGSLCQLELTETHCQNGCGDAGCIGEPCAGVACTKLPAASCLDANTLETVEGPGTCSDGACLFRPVRVACPGGCINGVCADNLCAGQACTTPPAAVCLDGRRLRSFASPGQCAVGTGRCTYLPVDFTCASGCANNACLDDPCAGVTCNAPPAPTCESISSRRVWASPGTCTAGVCGYLPTTQSCPAAQRCEGGVCFTPSSTCTAANCTGCCMGTTCVALASQSQSSCGASGAMCSACASGFSCSAAGVCADVDECAINNGDCSANATCTNTPGARSCACKAGYSGDGVTCTASGAPTWHLSEPAHAPDARTGAAMAFDSQRNRVVLFGGYGENPSRARGDTWEWDGVDWSKRSDVGPSARSFAGMVYDANRKKVVLFGGSGNDDTWVWDGTEWRLLEVTAKPPGRSRPALAYDSSRKKVILFGGRFLNDLWELEGLEWVKLTVAGPAYRASTMVFDSARNVTLLFGGDGTNTLNDTWLWNGLAWANPSPAASPRERYNYAMAFDSVRNKAVLFGGRDYLEYDDGQTWEWNGVTWTYLAIGGPEPRSEAAMAFDSKRGRCVLFGGGAFTSTSSTYFDETWEYDP